MLDQNLSWKEHVEYIGKKISSRLGMRRKLVKSCLNFHVLPFIVQRSYRYSTIALLSGKVVALATRHIWTSSIGGLPASSKAEAV